MKQLKKVNIKYKTGETLQKMFKVSLESISKAVNGRTNSELARNIRKAAVELGGDPIFGEIVRRKQKRKLKTNGVLAEKFDVTTQTIRNARRGIHNSELSEKIRKAAVKLGGDPIYENSNH
jgi:hypothetical protein